MVLELAKDNQLQSLLNGLAWASIINLLASIEDRRLWDNIGHPIWNVVGDTSIRLLYWSFL